MIVARGLGQPGLPLVSAGLGLSGEYIPPVELPRPIVGGGRPAEDLQRKARQEWRRQLLREDRELVEIITLLVTRVLE